MRYVEKQGRKGEEAENGREGDVATERWVRFVVWQLMGVGEQNKQQQQQQIYI